MSILLSRLSGWFIQFEASLPENHSACNDVCRMIAGMGRNASI
jgi:hypothetical protein